MNKSTTSTSTSNQHSQKLGDNSVVIYCDGAGSRPDGKGSGFSWIQPLTGERHVEQMDGLTNNQAEYLALISALTFLPDGSAAQVFTDSQLMWAQMVGHYKVHDTELAQLLLQVRDLIKKKKMMIDVQWLPRQRNLAGKLL